MSVSKVPVIKGIDHVHVYVSDRQRSEKWYTEILGYQRVAGLAVWATADGPLTLVNSEGNVHLALFERQDVQPSSALAFGASGREFIRWAGYLDDSGIELRISDHDLSVSLYFKDIDQNLLEITTYDHVLVRSEFGLVDEGGEMG